MLQMSNYRKKLCVAATGCQGLPQTLFGFHSGLAASTRIFSLALRSFSRYFDEQLSESHEMSSINANDYSILPKRVFVLVREKIGW